MCLTIIGMIVVCSTPRPKSEIVFVDLINKMNLCLKTSTIYFITSSDKSKRHGWSLGSADHE